MKTPKISVLMPAYNAEKYIGEAIESILNQSFTDFEYIIIDDCSTDSTWSIIQSYAEKDNRIVPMKNDVNLKVSATRNRGLSIAKGEYLALMDSDDWSYPDRLQKQYDFMEKYPDIGVSGGSMQVCDADMNIQAVRSYNLNDSDIRKKLFRYSPFCHPLTIYRLSNIRADCITYSAILPVAEDYDLYFKIGRKSKFGNMTDILLKYRVVSTGLSMSKAREQESATLYMRIKAVMEYGYKMSIADKLYFIGQLISMYIISPNIKNKIFNLFRNS